MNHDAIFRASPADINLSPYIDATKAIANDYYKDICTWIMHTKPCNEKLPLTPTIKNLPDPKRQRMHVKAPAPTAAPASAVVPDLLPAPVPNSWGHPARVQG